MKDITNKTKAQIARIGLFVCILLVSNALNAQEMYDTQWKKVTEAESKGLPKTALELSQAIYVTAKKEQKADQQIKALLFQMKYIQQKEEDGFIKSLIFFRTELAASVSPVKPLLHSILAELYWNYYQQNRWRFAGRSATIDFKEDDLETWSLEKIIQEVIQNYTASLADPDALKKFNVNVYKAALVTGYEMGEKVRPTLYDFIAHRALDVFKNSEPDLTKPAYTFVINKEEYLANTEDFLKIKIESKDKLSYKYYALQILQDLIRFHLNDPNPEALIDVDLERYSFVNQHLTSSIKTDLYLKALETLEARTLKFASSTYVTHQIANIWVQKGSLYQPLQSDEHKLDIRKAYEIAEGGKKRFPESNGASLCSALMGNLLTKSIGGLSMEACNTPQKTFKMYFEYKNISEVYYRIVPVSRKELREQRKKYEKNYDVDREEKFVEYLISLKPLKTGKFDIKDDQDLQKHATELYFDGLNPADYMILLSHQQDFKMAKNSLNYGFTTVSNLSYIHRNNSDGSTSFYVLDRTTSEPVANAQIRVMTYSYSYNSYGYKARLHATGTTNSEGFYLLPSYNNSEERSFDVEITLKNDIYNSKEVDTQYENGGSMYQSRYNPDNSYYLHTYFFLDRTIYRPNQTVYFKGLAVDKSRKDNKIRPNQKIDVIFYDTNHQEVVRQTLTTNEYGTFNGTFQTPSKGLMGQMTLQTAYGSATFSVEEYKRPKFEVVFENLKGTYRLNDKIKSEGVAKAYSGANIDNADVKYRVVREAKFPYWWYCWRGYYPSSPAMEITSGTTKTDDNGKFFVEFTAIPDENVDKTSDPTFNYTIYADVTDINGETHSSETYVNLGYKALVVGATIPNLNKSDEKDQKRSFNITTTNLMGEFEPAKGNIKIFRLKSPEKALNNRLWKQADRPILSKNAFEKLFPNDEYEEENNYLKWKREDVAFEINFDTQKETKFGFNLSKLKTGKYVVEITSKDKFGQDVKENSFFTIIESESKNLALAQNFEITPLKITCEPNEKAQILLGTSKQANILYEVEQDGVILSKKWLSLKGEQTILEVPITEAHRGNLSVHLVFVHQNRFYSTTQVIQVPYTNKMLDISFETFRDKTQPGSKEEWKLKVKGKNADKIAAEMVATLYDASLDAFGNPNFWDLNLWTIAYGRLAWSSQNNFKLEDFGNFTRNWNETMYGYNSTVYPSLNYFGYSPYYYAERSYAAYGITRGGDDRKMKKSRGKEEADEKTMEAESNQESPKMDSSAPTTASKPIAKKEPESKPKEDPKDLKDVKVRTNFNETAFFYPTLQTNENGEIIIKFVIPESLTKWKMLGLAHTKDLKMGSVMNTLVTQKDLMVVPNQPRFFRENDEMQFSVKLTSLTEKMLNGQAKLEFLDAVSGKNIDDLLKNKNALKDFSVKAGQSQNLIWDIKIPEGIYALTYRVVAKSGDFSDGEEMLLPVVTNRMLVTESMPLPIRGKQTKEFTLEKMVQNESKTLTNHRFTLEFTSNPAWYAVQALPYMMEYPYECVEQTFSRFYANSIASNVAGSNPKIKKVFDTWRNIQPEALMSNLEKNQELKNALLEETPWVLNAQNESQRKRNVALLFDLNRMADEMGRAIDKIQRYQTSNGGFTWFPGFPEDRYMTQYIVTGMGHLDVMGVKKIREDRQIWNMTQKALNYLEYRFVDDHQRLLGLAKQGKIKLEDNHLSYEAMQFLYAWSYFKNDRTASKDLKAAIDYFVGQSQKYWLSQNLYMQGMMTLYLYRFDKKETIQAMKKSFDEKALRSEEFGMYWKEEGGWWWYQAPIERQALFIEVYDEAFKDQKSVEDLKVWLLKQKQTQDWKTTRATSEACFALLRRGSDALASEKIVEIKLGGESLTKLKPELLNNTEAGTGYFKTAWTKDEIKPKMGKVTVTKTDEGVAWGAVYWQYFEQLDKITPAKTPLQLKKQLFIQKNTDTGLAIEPISDKNPLKIGDLVKVRIELRVDRDMEYVHLKDMRGACFEPTNVFSSSKYQDGLWYYESTKDLATHFFFGYLRKGTYVFEYPLRVSQKGDFSNGISTIQCMYAPEFSSHSEGIRVVIK